MMRHPWMYLTRFCEIVKEQLGDVEVHGLWLVPCFLIPFPLDMGLCDDDSEGDKFTRRVEAFTRIIYGEVGSQETMASSDRVIFH